MKLKALLLAAFCGGCCIASVSHAMTTSLSVVDPMLEVGTQMMIRVQVQDVFDGLDPGDEVLAFGFDVHVSDASVFTFLTAAVAPPFDDDSALFVDTDVAGSVFSGIVNTPSNNSLLLAYLTFDVVGTGTGSIEVTSDLFDANEGLVYLYAGNLAVFDQLTLTVFGGAAVAGPETSWLLILGLLLMGMSRRPAGLGKLG